MGLLRIILAISVVAAHTGFIFGFSSVGGVIAVETFFIISGFYMSFILNEKYNSYKTFIINRLLRIYPTYWVVLVLTLILTTCVYMHSGNDTQGLSFSINTYVNNFGDMSFGSKLFIIATNMVMFGQDAVLFLGLNVSNGLLFFTTNYRQTQPLLYTFLLVPQAWSLGVELLFYLVIPFIAKKKSQIIAIFIVISFVLRFFLYSKGLNHDPWTYRLFPTELAFFLLGTLSYKIYSKVKYHHISQNILTIVFTLTIGLTLFFQFVPVYMLGGINVYQYLYYSIIFLAIPFLFLYSKNNRIDRYIGELSYPVYISHLFIAGILNTVNKETSAFNEKYLSFYIVICTIIFSMFLYKFICKPIDKYRDRIAKK